MSSSQPFPHTIFPRQYAPSVNGFFPSTAPHLALPTLRIGERHVDVRPYQGKIQQKGRVGPQTTTKNHTAAVPKVSCLFGPAKEQVPDTQT